MSLPMRLKTSLYRAFYRHVCRRKYVVAATHGCEFVLWPENYVDRRIWIEGIYEPQQIETMLRYARENAPDVFLDVGANIGLYSCIVGKNTNIGEIHAFECDPRNVAFLKTHLHMNGLCRRAQMHDMAVGDSEGSVELYLAADTSTGKSSVVAPSTSHRETLTVPQQPIDNLLDIRNKTVLMKIDVEGYELSALRGMQRLLSDNRCILQIEIFPGSTMQETHSYLRDLGYRLEKNIEHDHYFKNF